MRLTLRTMLAYVDDILEATDAQDVGKKIAESEFATGLMHRMRDVTRRLRLGAPKLYGRGMGHDPNTVAEYLDNRLPSERVADFEKVCLESDVHLAEVASCHQILALVLGEPAEIESSNKQRMYALPQQAESAAHAPGKTETPLGDGAARSSAKRKKKRRKVKVPEYLRGPAPPGPTQRRWGPLVAIGLLVLLAGGGLATYWSQISRHLPALEPDEASEKRVAANKPSRRDEENGSADADAADRAAPDKQPDKQSTKRSTKQPTNTQSPANAAAVEPAEDEDANAVPVQSPANRSDKKPRPEGDKDSSTAGPDQAAEMPQADKRPRPTRSPNKTRSEERPSDERAVSNEGPAAPSKRTAKQADEEPPREAPSGEGIGRLISEHDVLLLAIDDQWQRIAVRGTVHAGERLIALPTYRPSVAMSNGVTLQLLGGTIVSLQTPADDGAARIEIVSGRILLLTVAKPETKIHLRAGDYQGTIEFGRDEAALAVELRHLLPEGADPEQEPAPTSVDLYLSSGEATWISEKGRSEKLSGHAHRQLGSSKTANQAAEELPGWMEANELNPTERRASADVETFLRPGKPVGPELSDLATHRKIENSLLAVQSLALIDDFEPIVPLLNDPKYRIVWTSQIESLRAALARSPKTAALVHEAFQTARGKEEGSELYRMLWGYTSQQLADGAAAQLIEWLGAPDEQLDFRVLSFWNLHHITGLGLYYQPADPEKQRRTSIQRWKQKLESGLLVPKAT